MKIEVAVIAWNGEDHLTRCLEAVLAQGACPDALVIDNASADRTVAIVRQLIPRFAERGRRLRIIEQPTNLGFTGGANVALALGREGEYEAIVLLNQDATLAPDCVDELAKALERDPRIGIVGCKIFYPDGVTLQHAGGVLNEARLVGKHHGERERDNGQFDDEGDAQFVTGAVMAVRVAMLREIGLFEESFAPGYYEDVELCTRARSAGWRVVYSPKATARHVESASFSDRFLRFVLSHRNRFIFAMPFVAEPSFANRFLAAEREALRSEPTEIVRAISLASLQVLTRLEPLARARGVEVDRVAPALEETRAAGLDELQKRRRAVLAVSG